MDKELLSKINLFVEEKKNEIKEDLFALCRVPSVRGENSAGAPFGENPKKALFVAAGIAEKYGIKAEVNADRGYAELSLGGGKKTLGVLAHVDVVPAGEDWTVTEPFSPVLKDGWLYGRGVTDDKNGVIAGIYLLRAAKELNLPFKSRLLTITGCCEETGMEDIENYLSDKKEPDFCMVPDASFPVCFCEKDICDVKIISKKPFKDIIAFSGGVAANAVAASAEAVFPFSSEREKELSSLCLAKERLSLKPEKDRLVLTAKGITAHASTPENSINAVYVLCDALSDCKALCAGDRKILSAAAKAAKDPYGKGLFITSDDITTGRLTCVCGLASVRDKRLELSFNIRYAKASNEEKVRAGINAFCLENGFKTVSFSVGKGYYNDPSGKLITSLTDIYKEITGEKDAKPYFMGGGTYARHLKNALAFGLNFDKKAPGLPAGHGKEHEPDESYKLDDFLKGIKIYIAAALSIDKIINE